MNGSNRKKILGGAAAVVVVALLFLWWRSGAVKAPKYRTEPVEIGSIVQMVSATGTVNPVEQVEIGSQVSGTVAKLNADFNTRVKKGQVLLQIEPSSFRAKAVQAGANVAHSQAVANEMKRNYDRAVALLPEKYISQADVDAALSKYKQAQADLKQAEAQLQAANVDLANTTIRSPIDGVVIDREIDLGQTVAASLQAPKLFVIANDLSRMQIETKIDEADIGQVRPGLPATFTVDAFPDQTFDGVVAQVRLEPVADQNVVTYTTVINTANPSLRLRPGMTANVSVQVASRDDVLKVPNSALRFRPPGAPAGNGRRAGGAGRGAASADVAAGGAANGGGNVSTAGDPAAAGGGGARWRHGAAGDSTGGRAGRGGAWMNGGGRWSGRGGAGDSTHAGRGNWAGGAGGRGGRGAGGNPAAPPPDVNGQVVMGTVSEPRMKHGTVYVLKNGKPQPISVRTGISDGASTEVISDQLRPGDLVVIGVESTGKPANASLAPPPGFGGRGGGGGGRGGR